MNRTQTFRRAGVLLLGFAAGYGAGVLANRAARSRPTTSTGTIDWERAQRLALRLSGWHEAPLHDRAARQEQYQELVSRSEPLIADYLGVNLPRPVDGVRVVDRREWLEANFATLPHMLEPFEGLLTRRPQPGALTRWAGGSQVGVLFGFLARHVLGQYDLSLLSPEPELQGTLLFVEPNVDRLGRRLRLDDGDLRLWLTLHEMTHVFEFEAHPWVRPYVRELLGGFLGEVGGELERRGGLGRLVRRLLSEGSAGHPITWALGPAARDAFERMQAFMSLAEGYSNHVMNAVGRQLIPSFAVLEARIEARGRQRPPLTALLEGLLGMDLKRAQYRRGQAFVDAVVAARGADALQRLWEGPETLPTPQEIGTPSLWLARVGS